MAELVDRFLKEIENQQPVVKHNEDVIRILEGDLLHFIEEHFAKEFTSQDSIHQVFPRIAPINFLKRIIDKLSKIYQENSKRKVLRADGSEDPVGQEILEWYLKSTQWNEVMNCGNEYFNAFKNNLNQIYLVNGMPKLRAIPNDRFYLYSNNMIEPNRPTHIIIPQGKKFVAGQRKQDNRYINEYVVWSDEEVYKFDAEGVITPYLESGEFENPFSTVPYMYVNRSKIDLIPSIDTDTKRMSILLPALMSDLAYAVKFQSFSIIYTINADDANLKLQPNGLVSMKQEPGSDVKPEIGQLKPQVDIAQVIELITTQLSMWLNSRNIRPGTIGQLGADKVASGISKMVDEMDTSDERKKQVEIYRTAEQDFFSRLMHKIHPVWVDGGLINETRKFSEGSYVQVEFPQQLPLLNRGDIVRDLRDEVEAGFVSVKTAMQNLNPNWDEARIEQEMQNMRDEALGGFLGGDEVAEGQN